MATNPRSTSQALAILIMESQKLKENEVELVRTGGFGAGLTMLEIGVDVVPVAEPLWSKNQGKYKLIAAAPDILPRSRTWWASPPAKRRKRRAISSAA